MGQSSVVQMVVPAGMEQGMLQHVVNNQRNPETMGRGDFSSQNKVVFAKEKGGNLYCAVIIKT